MCTTPLVYLTNLHYFGFSIINPRCNNLINMCSGNCNLAWHDAIIFIHKLVDCGWKNNYSSRCLYIHKVWKYHPLLKFLGDFKKFHHFGNGEYFAKYFNLFSENQYQNIILLQISHFHHWRLLQLNGICSRICYVAHSHSNIGGCYLFQKNG